MGGEQGNEAHGGYTFCGVAALALLGRLELLQLPRLGRWLSARQLPFEGGFQGRTQKLVDSCYSFWNGSVPSLVAAAMGAGASGGEAEWYNRRRLQEWVLCCCQDPRGGLKDKPDRPRDYYHTCYSLSGLSLAQHGLGTDAEPMIVRLSCSCRCATASVLVAQDVQTTESFVRAGWAGVEPAGGGGPAAQRVGGEGGGGAALLRRAVALGAANARPWSQTCCRLGMFLLSCASLCSRTSHTVLATQHELRVDVVVFGRLTLATSPTHSRRTPRAWRPHRAPVASLRPAWRPVGRSCSRSSSWAIAGAPPTPPPHTNSTKNLAWHAARPAAGLWPWGALLARPGRPRPPCTHTIPARAPHARARTAPSCGRLFGALFPSPVFGTRHERTFRPPTSNHLSIRRACSSGWARRR